MPNSKQQKSLLLRLSPLLHRRLLQKARAENLSVNSMCIRFITAGLEGQSSSSFDTLRQLIEKQWGNQFIGLVLFGSAARGTLRQNSDLDLLLVIDGETPLTRSLYTSWDETLDEKAREIFVREVNPHFVHLPTDPLRAGGIWLESALEGRVLFDRSGAIERFLQELRGHIARGGIERAAVHGHPYWITSRET